MENTVDKLLEWPQRQSDMILDAWVMRDVEELIEICDLSLVDLGMSIEGPQAAYLNGRLPNSVLMAIPYGRLERSAAVQWIRMRNYIGQKHGVWIRPNGPNSSFRSYAAQIYFWNLYRSGRGNTAAYPGTSNHGWGRAVDVLTPQMAQMILAYGHLFGWSHAEGARVGEWWHFTYVGGAVAPPKRKPDPLRFLTKQERFTVTRIAYHRRIMAHEAKSGRGPRWKSNQHWASYYKGQIKKQMAAITKAHKKDPNWAHKHRGVRYQILRKAYNNTL